MDLLNIAKNRYTTKAYDPTQKIPEEKFNRLLALLRLTPSSINIQPWHFLIAQTQSAKQRIAKGMTGRYAYNAPKILDSSHSIVFCTLIDANDSHLKQLLEQDELNGRFKDEKAKQAQRDARAGYVDFYRNEKNNLFGWMENQTFIALGQILLAASIENIDATPIGGFDQAALNQEFNLTEKGLRASVVLALGYRSETDFNAKLPKSRLSENVIFTTL